MPKMNSSEVDLERFVEEVVGSDVIVLGSYLPERLYVMVDHS